MSTASISFVARGLHALVLASIASLPALHADAADPIVARVPLVVVVPVSEGSAEASPPESCRAAFAAAGLADARFSWVASAPDTTWPPPAETARGIAAAQRADLVLMLRREAGPSLAFELRSGHSGASLERQRAPLGADCVEAAYAGADAVQRALRPLGETASEASVEAARTLEGLRVESLPRDLPITIESEELEVSRRADRSRHLVFRQNVRVTQGDVRLRSDRLEAFYPEGATQPDRMLANGRVEVRQAGRVATCEQAVYQRADESVLCSGNAELQDGCDRVRGREIELDLARERVRVLGAASVWIESREGAASSACADGAG